jgi:hypothetical protein
MLGEHHGGLWRRGAVFFSAVCVGCTLLIGSHSWAATIEPCLGDLTINQGKGFKPVTSRTSANVGDSVMVGPGGTATVTYDDGCKVSVQPGAVTTIAPLSPCASGSYAADMGLPPAAAGAPAGAPAGTADPYLTLLMFGGFAGGIAYLVTTVRSGQGPASP